MFDLPPPAYALESLVDCRYGYSFVDMGLFGEDLNDFNAIDIQKDQDFNRFGDLANLEAEIGSFLNEIGPNDAGTIQRVARRVHEIAMEILAISDKESCWVFLRASTPNDRYDLARWHMDGHYYNPVKDVIQYKFVLTLKGPSTLFYPIPRESIELRRVIWRNMNNRQFMTELCDVTKIATPQKGQGAFFIAGNSFLAAVHSEPPIHESRLFFSITPCNQDELAVLRGKVMEYYKYQP
jgi:hypothetical protein